MKMGYNTKTNTLKEYIKKNATLGGRGYIFSLLVCCAALSGMYFLIMKPSVPKDTKEMKVIYTDNLYHDFHGNTYMLIPRERLNVARGDTLNLDFADNNKREVAGLQKYGHMYMTQPVYGIRNLTQERIAAQKQKVK